MTDSYSMGTKKFDEEFCCPICLDVFNDPVVVRCCGNTYCEKCIQAVGAKCPYCDIKTEFTKNLIIKRIIDESEVKCKCGVFFKRNEALQHKIVCRLEPKKCRYCAFIGCAEDRLKHGMKDHQDVILRAFTQYID
ncbi:hypothetical protein SteCoe_16358 [Stentor coeruleus]|uniref:RING-type domain-containing protein n=1 Tax=Stentor coeruleus TaxID=5963 RepID=A0A1R2C1L5_9CILI|nr:hypothetical protein SteCoe_16358 [Stentor coeruleus]